MKIDLTTPNAYVKSLDWANKQINLRKMTRADYNASSFLDARTISSEPEFSVPISEFVAQLNAAKFKPRRANYIFHTTFCGSTLLARCLDSPDICFALKEPNLLHDFSFFYRDRWPNLDVPDRDQWLAAAITLLSRTYTDNEVPLIKPSDSCNNLAGRMLSHHLGNRGLMLYSSLPNFCISMLTHETRIDYLRRTMTRAVSDLNHLGFDVYESSAKSDAQLAGLVWFSMIAQHLDILSKPEMPVFSLDAALFYDDPQATLERLSAFFKLSHTSDGIANIIEKGAFVRDSKKMDTSFDKAKSRELKRLKRIEIWPEIERAQSFIQQVTQRVEIPKTLPRCLFDRAEEWGVSNPE